MSDVATIAVMGWVVLLALVTLWRDRVTSDRLLELGLRLEQVETDQALLLDGRNQ